MARLKSAWDKLSMNERALLIKLSVDNGVSSLKLIRDTYNLYSSDLNHKYAGDTESTQNLSFIGKDRFQDIAYRIMSQSSAEKRSIKDIFKAVKDSYTNADYEINYTGADPYLFHNKQDANSRDSNWMFLYGNTKGHYTPITKEEYRGHSYAPFIKKHYPNKEVLNYYGQITPLNEVVVPTYMRPLVDFLVKNDFGTYDNWVEPSDNEVEYALKHGYHVDDVGAFRTGIGHSPSGELELQLSDLTDFGGGNYDSRYGIMAGIQGTLLNKVGNPFMLRQFIPARYSINTTEYTPGIEKTILNMARDNGVSTYDNITDTYEILGSLPEIEVYGNKKSTGGPLYPFSFEKNTFLKTPIVRYDDGGLLTNWEQGALDRATEVYSNYELAKDNKIPLWRIPLQKKLKQLHLPSGLSNCTLTATLWVDPTNPIMSAATIFNNHKTGYTEIDSKDAIPGNLLITKNPETGGYHTMMIDGFNDSGEPILRYSNGDHTADALRTNISLSEYHSRDNSQGGNHTEDHYFRYNYPNEVFLPEITVFALSGHKKAGNEVGETLDLDTSKVDIAAWYKGDNNRKRGINVKELELFLDSLIANNIPLTLRLAILGTSAQETGTEGAASYGIGGMGLLGLSGQRMDSALVSHNPDTVGMQIHFLILDLKKRHSDNWLDGGTGGPKITTGKEGFEKFWNGTDVDTVTLILNKSYIRPAERLDVWLNRAKVAKSMINYLK